MGTLDDVFNIIPAEKIEQQVQVVVDKDEESPEDTDFKYTRQNQIDLIEVGKAAVQTAMKVAVESENPKALESLALMLKTASEMNKQLVGMSKDVLEVKQAKKDAGRGSTPTIGSAQTVNNIVMTGTMQDMLNQLKSLKDVQ